MVSQRGPHSRAERLAVRTKLEMQAKLSREPSGPRPLTASSRGTPARGAPGHALSSRELPHLQGRHPEEPG